MTISPRAVVLDSPDDLYVTGRRWPRFDTQHQILHL